MKNIEELSVLPDEKLRMVNGGDGGAIYGKDIEPDGQSVEIAFTKAPQDSNGGAIYYGSSGSQQFCEITFVNNTAGQSGGAVVSK